MMSVVSKNRSIDSWKIYLVMRGEKCASVEMNRSDAARMAKVLSENGLKCRVVTRVCIRLTDANLIGL